MPHNTTSMEFLIKLITFLVFLMPTISSSQYQENLTSYVVVFDAGSNGTSVHVYYFDQNLDLLHIGKDVEFYNKTIPGLSAYADNPKQAAAESLIPLLEQAERVVPVNLQPKTPVTLGAITGLRLLDGNSSDNMFATINYTVSLDMDFGSARVGVGTILRNAEVELGNTLSLTLGDIGGGITTTFAVSREQAKKAPQVPEGEDPYIKIIVLKGKKYYLYVHSYLRFGKEASRAEILKVTNGSPNPCILAGYHGTYTYSGEEYKAFSPASGPNFDECKAIILKALKVNYSCPYEKCTFGGIWNGGGGSGPKTIYATSSFYYVLTRVGIADPNKPNSKFRIVDLKTRAEQVCKTKYKDAKATYPLIYEDNLPYACLDLIYQYTLFVYGFGLDPLQEITVANQIQYQDALVDAAWPLGNATEAISSLPKFDRFMYYFI